MKLFAFLAACALALVPAAADAQSLAGKKIVAPAGYIPATAIYCDDGSGNTVICSSSGGGGSGVDPRVAQGSTTAGQTIQLTACAVVSGDQSWTANTTQPCTMTTTGRIRMGLSSAGPIAPGVQAASQSTADLVACTYRTPIAWTLGWNGALQCDPNGNLSINNATLSPGAATSALQTTGNASLATLSGTVQTVGTTTPTTAQFVAGKDQSGNARGLATSTNGGLLPGQAAPTSTRTAITASTITTIDVARSGRLGVSVQIEGALTANLFLCANGQSGTCSATVYDAMIPSGATAGTLYTFVFAPTGILYAFTTGTPTVNTTSWLAQ